MVSAELSLMKLHGLGNDFLVLVALDGALPDDLGELARRVCDRHRGVGADGLLTAVPGTPSGTWTMTLHNADGSRAEMSGNGIRCLAHAIVRRTGAATPITLVVHTDGGDRSVDVTADPGGASDTVMATVSMGDPAPGPDVPSGVVVADGAATWDLGNPHLVLAVDDPSAIDLAMDGPAYEQHFAEGINVHFVAVSDTDEITQVTWERGAGITEACGTGATAAALSARAWGLVGPSVDVHMPGGTVHVDLGDTPMLTGPSQWIADVVVDE